MNESNKTQHDPTFIPSRTSHIITKQNILYLSNNSSNWICIISLEWIYIVSLEWIYIISLCIISPDFRFLHLVKCLSQGCQIWHPNWVRLAQIGQIWDFLRSVSVHFGSASQNVLKSDLKKSQICPIWANLTQFGCQI